MPVKRSSTIWLRVKIWLEIRQPELVFHQHRRTNQLAGFDRKHPAAIGRSSTCIISVSYVKYDSLVVQAIQMHTRLPYLSCIPLPLGFFFSLDDSRIDPRSLVTSALCQPTMQPSNHKQHPAWKELILKENHSSKIVVSKCYREMGTKPRQYPVMLSRNAIRNWFQMLKRQC